MFVCRHNEVLFNENNECYTIQILYNGFFFIKKYKYAKCHYTRRSGGCNSPLSDTS